MFLRTVFTLVSAAALSAAAQAASPCGTPGGAGCDRAAAAVATYDAPAKFLAKALAERKRKLGEEHPSTLATANALAVMYKVQGRHDEAEALYLHTLAACQRTLGDRHPLTLGTIKGLASLYKAEGRLAEVALLKKRASGAGAREYSF